MSSGTSDGVEASDRIRVFDNIEADVGPWVGCRDALPGFADETERSVYPDNFAQRFAFDRSKDMLEHGVE